MTGTRPRFDIVLPDSGGTLFVKRPIDPVSRESVWSGRFRRAARAAVALGWPGRPDALVDSLGRLEVELERRLGVGYGLDKLLIEAARQADPPIAPEDALLCADALAGPRYRGWLFPRTVETLARLRKAGVVLGVVANTAWPDWMMRRAFAGVGLAPFLEVVVCSCDVGAAKPDTAIFRRAVELLGGELGRRFCFVGDSIPCDIAGARAMGWPAALRRSVPAAADPSPADFQFDHWDELADWILPPIP